MNDHLSLKGFLHELRSTVRGSPLQGAVAIGIIGVMVARFLSLGIAHTRGPSGSIVIKNETEKYVLCSETEPGHVA